MKKINILLILLALVFSCKSFKKQMSFKGGKHEVLENVIIDYHHTNKKYTKEYDVFEVEIMTEDSDAYNLNISPRVNYFYLSIKDSLGSIPENFPTNYKEYNGKLFVWNDKYKSLNLDVLNKLHAFHKLDSINLKYELGIYSPHDKTGLNPLAPPLRINETIKEVYYSVCKKNIDKYDKSDFFDLTLLCD